MEKERYEVIVAGIDSERRYHVVDNHHARQVIASALTLREASIERSFLTLLHLKAMRARRDDNTW